MKPAVTYPDPERATVDLLAALVAPHAPEATVGVGVPPNWAPSSPPHFEVAWDGTPTSMHPVAEVATVRIVVRARTTTDAKRLAQLARGLLLAHDGHGPIRQIRPGIGVLPARDPATQAELASFTVLATVRSTSI